MDTERMTINDGRYTGLKHHAKVHSFRILTVVLAWLLIAAAFYEKPELLTWLQRAIQRSMEFVGDDIPPPWGPRIEFVFREIGGFIWLQITLIVVLLRVFLSGLAGAWFDGGTGFEQQTALIPSCNELYRDPWLFRQNSPILLFLQCAWLAYVIHQPWVGPAFWGRSESFVPHHLFSLRRPRKIDVIFARIEADVSIHLQVLSPARRIFVYGGWVC